MKPQLFLITKDFPIGHSEDSFVKPEYPYLCQDFQVEVISAESDPYQIQTLGEKIISFLRFLFERDCYRELWSILKDRKKVLPRCYRTLMFGTAAESFYRKLKKATGLNRTSRALYYFYWYDYRCFGLTMHKSRYPDIRIVARTHGYDLYDERELYGRQFFKPQMDEKLERLIFAAQYAKDYYLERYHKEDGAKYPLHRLGVSDKNITASDLEKRKKKGGEPFLLLSCSHAITIKRVDRIIAGLSGIPENRKIRWVHIGGGDQLEQLCRQAEQELGRKANIEYTFTGARTNEQVLAFYQQNAVDCFITTTSTEGGAPVSVQEALSYAVPVISAKIGELPQMVCGNGVLLSEEAQPQEVTEAIMKMYSLRNREAYVEMCKKSLEIYHEKFDSDRNFKEAANELKQLMKE